MIAAIVDKIFRWREKALSYLDDARSFCYRWAKLETKDYTFFVGHNSAWRKPWLVAFYDLHKWNGYRINWYGHDIKSGEGKTKEEAWTSMERRILEHMHAASREEALVKTELHAHKDLPRGWGEEEHCIYCHGLKTSDRL